jgi:hypothetical protein
MLFRKYGTSYQSVDIDFDAKALNDIGFRRNRERSVPAAEFPDAYSKLDSVELQTEADGPVQYETKQLLLDRLRAKVEELLARLPEGGLLVVENESGHDYPKTRQQTKNAVEDGENRLHFEYTMEPPLRLTTFRPRSDT